ncbi:MAG TPA: hypothetical protein VJZ71_03825 [Phycisphaerae bacterium]|nr:hypothetical protein [Phycisphaerae bacterium]
MKRFPSPTVRQLIVAFTAACGAWSATGCENDEPELPPEQAPAARAIEFDIQHVARIQADRSFSVANLVLVLQPDRGSGGSMGVTLTTSQPAADGSRLTLGTFEKAESLEALARNTIDFGGAALYDPRGNGIFTPLGAYQPKLASIRISSHDESQVSGTIRGDFYHFKPGQTTLRPSVIFIEAAFSAKLIVK